MAQDTTSRDELNERHAVLLENAIQMLYAYCLSTPFIMKGHSSSFNQHVTILNPLPVINKWLYFSLSHIYTII